MFYLCHQPEIYSRLMKDIEDVDPDNLSWVKLEQRPYLWAIIQEGLRVMPGIPARTARIARHEDLFYKGRDGTVQWVIPKGTPIGMSGHIQHHNDEIFPESYSFKPERWLVDGKHNYKMQKMAFAFGRGTRSCIGEK